MVNARWGCHPMISHTCWIGDRSGNLAGRGNMSKLSRACCVTTAIQCVWDNHESDPAVIGYFPTDHDSRCRFSVSMLQTVCLQAFLWSPFDQHMGITGIRAEPAVIKKYNRSPIHPSISSGLTPL
ncbi:uncharacterized protein TNCV_2781121 [Trichonephila clavipes]|nr:uncharacterized protein TNCV_2781121 [Trichonephila clavipes]